MVNRNGMYQSTAKKKKDKTVIVKHAIIHLKLFRGGCPSELYLAKKRDTQTQTTCQLRYQMMMFAFWKYSCLIAVVQRFVLQSIQIFQSKWLLLSPFLSNPLLIHLIPACHPVLHIPLELTHPNNSAAAARDCYRIAGVVLLSGIGNRFNTSTVPSHRNIQEDIRQTPQWMVAEWVGSDR